MCAVQLTPPRHTNLSPMNIQFSQTVMHLTFSVHIYSIKGTRSAREKCNEYLRNIIKRGYEVVCMKCGSVGSALHLVHVLRQVYIQHLSLLLWLTSH